MSVTQPPNSPPQPVERPLSPHLQIYKPQLTSGMSIFHRITGIALTGGLMLVVAWVVALASGPNCYNRFMGLITLWPMQIMLCGMTFAFFYHFCNGIRHLLWDAGWFLDLRGVYSTGRVTLGISVLVTIGLWLKILGHGNCPWL